MRSILFALAFATSVSSNDGRPRMLLRGGAKGKWTVIKKK